MGTTTRASATAEEAGAGQPELSALVVGGRPKCDVPFLEATSGIRFQPDHALRERSSRTGVFPPESRGPSSPCVQLVTPPSDSTRSRSLPTLQANGGGSPGGSAKHKPRHSAAASTGFHLKKSRAAISI